MKKPQIYMELFDFSVNTYYTWKREKRPIMKLLEEYHYPQELEEFIKTGKIERLTNYKDSCCQEMMERLNKLEKIVGENIDE
ncbi:MAG: hypothetical protein JXQ76_10895 [Campylobacterales bacterium]|nr:hypothetical protein [Campylobacterales bacterium]